MINNGIKQARRAIEMTYDSTCTISCYGPVKDPVTKKTRDKLNVKCTDKACKVSKKSLSKNKQTDTVNEIAYEIKLFIAPEVEILQGDTIEVTNALGIKKKYEAGEGFCYTTHQEVILSKEGKA